MAMTDKIQPAIAGRCANCRWAEPLERPMDDAEDSREAVNARRYPMTCKLASMRGGNPSEPRTLAFTMDGSSYRAELMVAPDFGCVQWEVNDA